MNGINEHQIAHNVLRWICIGLWLACSGHENPCLTDPNDKGKEAGYLAVCVRLPPVQILLEKVINLGFPAGQQAGGNASVSHGPVCPTGVGNGQTLLIKCDGHCVPDFLRPFESLSCFS